MPKSSKSPTTRTLEWLRAAGYVAQVVERWNPHASVRVDLYGCIDIVAICGPITVGIQATSADNMSARAKKIRALDGARQWLTGGTRQLWIVGWRQYMIPVHGKKWRERVVDVRLEDLAAEVVDDEASQQAGTPGRR